MIKIHYYLVIILNLWFAFENTVCVHGQDIQFVSGDIAKREGSECTFQHSDTQGICMHAKRCLAASSDFKQTNIPPTICSLASDAPIVCCAEAKNYAKLAKQHGPMITIDNRRKSGYCKLVYKSHKIN